MPSNFLHSVRICTRDECMNTHTKPFSFCLYLLSSPSFTFFLSFSSFFPPSFFPFSFSDSFNSFSTHAPVLLLSTWEFYGPLGSKITDPLKTSDVESDDLFFPLPFKEVCCNFCNRSKVISSYSNVCREQEFFEGLRVNLRLSSDHSVDGNESCVQGNVVTY